MLRQDIELNGDVQSIEQLRLDSILKIYSDENKDLELLEDKYKSPIPNNFPLVKE
jgi:type I restriction enzyme M protein